MPTGIDKDPIAKIRRATKMRKLALSQVGRASPNFKHGLSDTTEHIIWMRMISRCHTRSDHSYKNYGGRGIKVCQEWLNSFPRFLKDMGPKPKDKTLDRIDNNGSYNHENCRWATKQQQARNKRTTRWLELNGRRMTLSQWSEELSIGHTTILRRLKLGWSVEKALTTKIRNK